MGDAQGHRLMIEVTGLELTDDQVAELESAVRTAALTSLSRLGLADDLEERPLEVSPAGPRPIGRQFARR